MKFLCWNIEWMNNWFVGNNEVAFRDSYHPRGGFREEIEDVKGLAARVARVILELEPDAICIQEGPSDHREMELFINTYLTDRNGIALYQSFMGDDGRSQKLHTLVRKNSMLLNPRIQEDVETRALGEPWEADINAVGHLEKISFTRKPLVVSCEWNGKPLSIVNLHLKSNYINNGWIIWNSDPQQFISESLVSRRRISAESYRVRKYLENMLIRDPFHMVIVGGDLNDGPGLDYFEELYLTQNLTDILIGSSYYPERQFRHAFLDRVPKAERYTVQFNDFISGEQDRKLVLDHILVSPVLKDGGIVSEGLLQGFIAHQAFARGVDLAADSDREKYPSDHLPVMAVFGP